MASWKIRASNAAAKDNGDQSIIDSLIRRTEKIVRRCNGMNIASKMEVELEVIENRDRESQRD